MREYLDRNSKESLYTQVYEDIRGDILAGKLVTGEKLPSKRALAERLRVSLVTVENAYAQLLDEGYITARQRSGYYVQYNGGTVDTSYLPPQPDYSRPIIETDEQPSGSAELFPFTVWARLMRTVILEKGTDLLYQSDGCGVWELRCEISRYLYRARGISVSPRQIIIGAGTEYLYNMLIQLLGRERRYGTEDPCYTKLSRIYAVNGVEYVPIGLDEQGMSVALLKESDVSVAHISPAHHFPTGIVMPISRRREIMRWAEQADGRYIIEDDYDSEFRWSGKPVPSMFGMDSIGRVIYVNTFSMTIAPSVRIGYMCLPEELCRQWEERLGFCSCPVPVFEQYTLSAFISGGYFERHINRMKKHYRRLRELVLELFSCLNGIHISEERAGLHFLVRMEHDTQEVALICAECGIKFTPLSEYRVSSTNEESSDYVVNYYSANEQKLLESIKKEHH